MEKKTTTSKATTHKTQNNGRAGAPRKYDEPTKSLTLKLPVSAIQRLRDLAALYGESATQYVLKKVTEDYQQNKAIIDRIEKLRNNM